MKTKAQTFEAISKMKDGDRLYFNMFQEGGAVTYKCNGMYLLFEVPNFGGQERYEGTFPGHNIDEMIERAYGWT